MFTSDVLLSQAIIDLPPKETYKNLSAEEQQSWLNYKLFWTEIYAAFTRYQSGLPAKAIYWTKAQTEMFMTTLNKLLSLYKLINFGWDCIQEGCADIQDFPSTPGELFLSCLELRSLLQVETIAKERAFSPQTVHRELRKIHAGKPHKPVLVDDDENFLGIEFLIVQLCQKSKEGHIKAALREYLAAGAEEDRVLLKWTHPSKKPLPSGQWKDGAWHPSRKGVRHHPNPPEE
jgi:hypothetical protein